MVAFDAVPVTGRVITFVPRGESRVWVGESELDALQVQTLLVEREGERETEEEEEEEGKGRKHFLCCGVVLGVSE